MGIEELTELYHRTLKDNAEDMTRIMHVISKIGLVLVAQGLIKMEDLSQKEINLLQYSIDITTEHIAEIMRTRNSWKWEEEIKNSNMWIVKGMDKNQLSEEEFRRVITLCVKSNEERKEYGTV